MSQQGLLTYRDVSRRLLDYLGGDPSITNKRYALSAIQDAYGEFATAARWSMYYTIFRLNTVASQTAGDVEYDHTGGTYERQLTLTDSTWPTWAALGTVAISNVAYQVSARKSSTVLQLSVNSNPGADVAAETSYTLYRDTYPMPTDFVSAEKFVCNTNIYCPTYVHPGQWLVSQRYTKSPSVPRLYCYRGDPHYQGAMAVSFYPPPDAIYQYDVLYQRRPRPLLIEEYSTGTVTASSGSAVVAGSGTAWTSAMIGSVLRVSANATDVPEGPTWNKPYAAERTILDVASATSLTVDTAYADTYSGVKYIISDPVDIEQGAMMPAFMRCCEKQAAISRIMKNQPLADKLYNAALVSAREGDVRTFATRSAGGPVAVRPGFEVYPADYGT